MNQCDVQLFFTYHGINQQLVSEVVSDRKVIGFVGGTGIVFVLKTTNAKEDVSTRAEKLVFLVTVGLNAAIVISVKHNLVVKKSTHNFNSITLSVDIIAAGSKHKCFFNLINDLPRFSGSFYIQN